MSDNGNYTCQVFNTHGYINATYALTVYADDIFEGVEPTNATILADTDAVFNCHIKNNDDRRHTNMPTIKWMKQISRAEYADYIIQNNINEASGETQSSESNTENENENESASNERGPSLDEDDMLKSFYSASTLPPLHILEKNSGYTDVDDTFLLSDLMSDKLKKDEFNFDLYVPSEKSTANKAAKRLKPVTSGGDESVHYITLSASPLISEQISYSAELNAYVSKLTIKRASVKDSGVYVCFGGDQTSYNYRKSYLRVMPPRETTQNRPLPDEALHDLASLFKQQQQRGKNYYNAPPFSQVATDESPLAVDNTQSTSFLVVLIPVLLITAFAIASICYLKRMDDMKLKKSMHTATPSGLSSCSNIFLRLGMLSHACFLRIVYAMFCQWNWLRVKIWIAEK